MLRACWCYRCSCYFSVGDALIFWSIPFRNSLEILARSISISVLKGIINFRFHFWLLLSHSHFHSVLRSVISNDSSHSSLFYEMFSHLFIPFATTTIRIFLFSFVFSFALLILIIIIIRFLLNWVFGWLLLLLLLLLLFCVSTFTLICSHNTDNTHTQRERENMHFADSKIYVHPFAKRASAHWIILRI